jgi:hypothetical protein
MNLRSFHWKHGIHCCLRCLSFWNPVFPREQYPWLPCPGSSLVH